MRHKRFIFLNLAIYFAATVLVLLAIGPAFWLVAISLSTPATPINSLPGPDDLTFANYSAAWREGKLLVPLINSIVVTSAHAFFNVLLAALAAFPLARMNFRGRDAIFIIILSTLMIPEQVLVVPLFRTIVNMGLFDTLAAVVIPFSVSAFGIYLCRQAFISIPAEMEEAARMDGAGSLAVWWHVMVPLAAPTLATLAVFSIIASWSSLLWPLIVLQSPDKLTLPVRIAELLSAFATNIRWAWAASVIALIPMLIVYIAMQRWLQRGLLAGAVKG